MRGTRLVAAAVLMLALLGGCPSETRTPPADTQTADAPTVDAPTVDSHTADAATDPFLVEPCDPLVPTYCAFPFPSSVRLIADPTTATGRAVSFHEEMLPVLGDGQRMGSAFFGQSDGFSPGTPILAHFPGVDRQNLPGPDRIGLSLEADSPTVLLEADTGERVPHIAELDMLFDEDDQRAFIIQPMVRLRDDARYLVAIRGLVDSEGGSDSADGPNDERRRMLR